MREQTPDCLRCKRPMTLGFLLDVGDHGASRVSRWVEGAPEKSIWTGLKLKDRDVLPIRTFRCARCGYLESYALEEEVNS